MSRAADRGRVKPGRLRRGPPQRWHRQLAPPAGWGCEQESGSSATIQGDALGRRELREPKRARLDRSGQRVERAFLELYSGCGRLTGAMSASAPRVAVSCELTRESGSICPCRSSSTSSNPGSNRAAFSSCTLARLAPDGAEHAAAAPVSLLGASLLRASLSRCSTPVTTRQSGSRSRTWRPPAFGSGSRRRGARGEPELVEWRSPLRLRHA